MVKQINLSPPGPLHSRAIAGSSLTKVAEGLPSTGAVWPWARAEGDPSRARTLPRSLGLIEACLWLMELRVSTDMAYLNCSVLSSC